MGVKSKTVNIEYPVKSSTVVESYAIAIDEAIAEVAESNKNTDNSGNIMVLLIQSRHSLVAKCLGRN